MYGIAFEFKLLSLIKVVVALLQAQGGVADTE